MSNEEGYKGHRAGSAKERVHKVFDEKGKDAAVKKAVQLGKQETTARTWCSSWGSAKKGKKVAAKPAAKKAKPAKKAAPKKAAPAKKPAAKKPAVKRERVEESAAGAAA